MIWNEGVTIRLEDIIKTVNLNSKINPDKYRGQNSSLCLIFARAFAPLWLNKPKH
jgi:hypothetical protein